MHARTMLRTERKMSAATTAAATLNSCVPVTNRVELRTSCMAVGIISTSDALSCSITKMPSISA